MNVIELFRKAYLIIVCTTIFAGVNAQTVSPSLDKQVRVPAKEVNIITVGDLITAQTGFILSFNAQKIIAQKRLRLQHSSYSIRQLLSMIKEATGGEYTIYREHVIFHRITNNTAAVSTPTTNHTARHVTKPLDAAGVNQSHANASVKQVKLPVTKLSGNIVHHRTSSQPGQTRTKTHLPPGVQADQQTAVPLSGSSVNNDSTYRGSIAADHTDKKNGTTTNMMSDTITGRSLNNTMGDKRPYLLSYLTPATIAVPVVKPATPVFLPVTPAVQPHKRRYEHEKPGLFKPFVLAGFGADEIFYVNLQAKAGLTLIYGIADWSSNFSVSGFRYGAGSSYPLQNGWLIQLEATTGKLSKETSVRGSGDTSTRRIPLDVRSRLQRISLFAQKSIAQHLSVYAGPVLNHLKSDYQLNSRQVSLATITQTTVATEKDYSTVKPPYTLSNSAPAEPENIKTWIGLQIGINYRF